MVLGKDLLGYPYTLAKLPAAEYHIQAVMDFDRGAMSFSTAEGNGYSQPSKRDLAPASSGRVELRLDQVYKEKPFQPTDRVKLVDIPSKLLTAFHGRPMQLRAGVVLPASFKNNPERKYPIVYEIPGFSGTHSHAFRAAERNATDVAGVDMIHVVLDPSCRLGHHVFADSANNGPCGQALIEELIPAIERGLSRPRLGGGPLRDRPLLGRLEQLVAAGDLSRLLRRRLVHGTPIRWTSAISSASTWSSRTPTCSPIRRASHGRIARRSPKPLLFKEFSDMEAVMGHGGQLASFEAVFSPRGPDGKPRQLWNRASGDIDPAVARTWEKYDIRRVLENNWQTLGPKLAGKIHVYMGDEDTFYLEGATVLLKESLKKLGSDAVVEIFPKRNHGNLIDANLRKRMAQEMANRYRQLQAARGRE